MLCCCGVGCCPDQAGVLCALHTNSLAGTAVLSTATTWWSSDRASQVCLRYLRHCLPVFLTGLYRRWCCVYSGCCPRATWPGCAWSAGTGATRPTVPGCGAGWRWCSGRARWEAARRAVQYPGVEVRDIGWQLLAERLTAVRRVRLTSRYSPAQQVQSSLLYRPHQCAGGRGGVPHHPETRRAEGDQHQPEPDIQGGARAAGHHSQHHGARKPLQRQAHANSGPGALQVRLY